ncbi:MAG: hypothetical protein QM704_06560 [Anaeromyxobacteraceae bacterium]
MRTFVPLAATALAALLLASPALAQHAGKHDAASKAKDADEAADGPAAQAAAVDPSTGKLRALTPEEARALVEAMAPNLSQTTEGLREVQHTGGAVSVDLEGRFESATVAKLATGGNVETRCVTTKAEAEQFLAPPKPAAKARKAASTPALEVK